MRELPTPGAMARHVVFSPDGRWLAAAGGVGVHVWDWRTGEEVAAGSAGHRGAIDQIATAPGGLIATASDDHTVRIWDAATGIDRRRLPHGHWVRAIAVSPDGRFLASSSLDDSVRLWDISNGKEVYKLPGHGLHGGNRAGRLHAGRPAFPLLRRRSLPAHLGRPDGEGADRERGAAARCRRPEEGDVDPAGRRDARRDDDGPGGLHPGRPASRRDAGGILPCHRDGDRPGREERARIPAAMSFRSPSRRTAAPSPPAAGAGRSGGTSRTGECKRPSPIVIRSA